MAIAILVGSIFVIMGIIFLFGKGGILIAGYNTASEADKSKYDIKRLNRCYAIFCFGIAATIGACGYVNTDDFALKAGLPIMIAWVLFLFIVSGTYCKKK